MCTQEVEPGARVEEEDVARLIQQLEAGIGAEVTPDPQSHHENTKHVDTDSPVVQLSRGPESTFFMKVIHLHVFIKYFYCYSAVGVFKIKCFYT